MLCREYNRRKARDKLQSKAENGDITIPQVKDFDELPRRCRKWGYEINRQIHFRAAGQERFTRTKTLGAAYTEEAIKERIKGVYVAKTKTLWKIRKSGFVVDLEMHQSPTVGGL